MPPLTRAAAHHPRLTTLLVTPSPAPLPACRHQYHSCSGNINHNNSISPSKRRFLPPKHPWPSLPCGSRSSFHSTCRRQTDQAEQMKQKNHYERLGVHTDATPAEIKKSFYSLSKAHHPDANPNDPTASHKFSLLSESYSLLSDPPRRAAYDRDTLRLHSTPAHRAHAAGSSYHSSAGGRAPSGLSRRRGTFRGPPPSFYRSGGWGAHTEKRRAAHESSTSSGGSDGSGGGHASSYDGASSASSQHGGMGPGSHPFGHREDVPHFDRRQHTRTHEYQDQRRSMRSQKRSAREQKAQNETYETGMGGHFLMVSGVLGAALLAPILYFQLANLGRPRKEK